MVLVHLCVLAVLVSVETSHLVFGLDNGVGLRPPMGFNTWNHYRSHFTASTIIETANAIASGDLGKAGYEYINLDDTWMSKERNSSTGELIPEPSKFPHGIQPVIDHIHSIGLKFGLYSSASDLTCQHYPASLYHEALDANTFSRWKVDYLKYDDCGNYDISTDLKIDAMRDALNASGRQIYFSTEPHNLFPRHWATTQANSWRTGIDIKPVWDSVLLSLYTVNRWSLAGYGGTGGWNDPDMLEVGNPGLTTPEQRSHFTLWCLVKAPLLIGCDVVNATQQTLSILSNLGVVGMNQDPLGIPGKLISSYNSFGQKEIKRTLITLACGARAEVPGQHFTVINGSNIVSDGLCLTGDSTEKVWMETCGKSSGQEWSLLPKAIGIKYIKPSFNESLCLTKRRMDLVLADCGVSKKPQQEWYLDSQYQSSHVNVAGQLRVSDDLPPIFSLTPDPVCLTATQWPFGFGGDLQVWSVPMVNNALGVVLFNKGLLPGKITAYWDDLGLPGTNKYSVKDLWQNKSMGTFSQFFTAEVGSHDVVAVHMIPV